MFFHNHSIAYGIPATASTAACYPPSPHRPCIVSSQFSMTRNRSSLFSLLLKPRIATATSPLITTADEPTSRTEISDIWATSSGFSVDGSPGTMAVPPYDVPGVAQITQINASAKRTGWLVMKQVLKTVKECSDPCPPLKAALSSVVSVIEIIDVCGHFDLEQCNF